MARKALKSRDLTAEAVVQNDLESTPLVQLRHGRAKEITLTPDEATAFGMALIQVAEESRHASAIAAVGRRAGKSSKDIARMLQIHDELLREVKTRKN